MLVVSGKYSQLVLRGHSGKDKISCLRQVIIQFFALCFGLRDTENDHMNRFDCISFLTVLCIEFLCKKTVYHMTSLLFSG